MNSSRTAETILVVDDSEAVCEVIDILLSRAGKRVLTATNGDDALEIARNNPEIDLLMSNVEMPGMRGDELASKFAAIHPSVPVVFIWSWDEPIAATEPFEFLAKPFTVAELRDAVSRALRARPAFAETPCAA